MGFRKAFDTGCTPGTKIEICCQACQQVKSDNEFIKDHDICDECIAANDNSEYCEPCLKLDRSLINAIEQIQDTWVCKRCANVIRFMQNTENQNNEREMLIMIRLGKIPF